MMFREGQAHSPTNSPYTKIRHLSKQRILYIQFSALVKSNARMFNCGGNTHRDRLFRTIPRSAPTFQKPHYPTCFSYGEGLCVLGWLCVLAKPLDTHAKASLLCSPHVCPFTQYVNHSQVCSPAHSSAFGTASPQDRYKAQK